MAKLFFPYHIPNLEIIQKELINLHGYRFESEKMDSFLVDWNLENFASLYEFLRPKLKKKYLFIKRARFFITPPGFFMYPHIDGYEPTGEIYALNIPIIIPDRDHYHIWYENYNELIKINSSTYNDCLISSAGENLKIKDRLKLESPHFVQIGNLHSVINMSDSPRVVLSLRIKFPIDGNVNYESIFENL